MCQNDEAGTATPEKPHGRCGAHLGLDVQRASGRGARRVRKDRRRQAPCQRRDPRVGGHDSACHFFPLAWPRVTCTKSRRRQWRRRSRQRSRREPRCQSTRFEPSLALCQPNDLSIRSSVRMASRVSCTDPFGSRPSSMAEMNSRSINSIPLSDTATSLRSIWFSRPS